MKMNKLASALKELTTPGTPQCSLTYAVLGAVIAALLLIIGFWKTLFILVFAAAGALLGGISNKKETVRSAINRRFPSKDEPLKEKTRTPIESKAYNENKPDDQV